MVNTLTKGKVVIYDLEWTSWAGFQESGMTQPGRYPEIIQIGAVKLDVGAGFRETDAFLAYVMPGRNPQLSDYIIDLTGITQDTLDAKGVPFARALSDFVAFIGDEADALCAYGPDQRTVRKNCAMCDIPLPAIFEREQDLRTLLIDLNLVPPTCYSSDVPAHLGLEVTERSHDALGDARALAAAIRHLRREGAF